MTDTLDVASLNTCSMECIRCGICCTRYQAIVSLEEVQQIASYLGISMNEWVKLYCEPRWHSHKNYLIRHVNAACIFLKYTGNMSYCDIQPVKPSCCYDWIPCLENKECQDGLRKNIGIRVCENKWQYHLYETIVLGHVLWYNISQ
jgi:Fe-S-cluster containining protein